MKFKFTPEQRGTLIKQIKESIIEKIQDSRAFSELYYEYGCDYYMSDGCSLLESKLEFLKEWDAAFKQHSHGLMVANKAIDTLETLVDQFMNNENGYTLDEYFTINSCMRTIKAMDKQVMSSPAVKKLLEANAKKRTKDESSMKRELEKMGYEVTRKSRRIDE